MVLVESDILEARADTYMSLVCLPMTLIVLLDEAIVNMMEYDPGGMTVRDLSWALKRHATFRAL